MQNVWTKLTLAVLATSIVACASKASTPTPTAFPWPTVMPLTAAPPTAVVPPTAPPTAVPPMAMPTHAVLSVARLLLATTTSTQDSGLLGYLLPDFEEAYSVKVDVVAVGSGQAMKLGQDGNADVLLVHSRAAEDMFMAEGHGVRREDVMYNDFVVVGPPSDPAKIRGIKAAAEAFQKVATAEAKFVSRGDDSGTNTKELGIWNLAKVDVTKGGPWYISAGQGMGAVLTMAEEMGAYTLCDRATYLARKAQGLQLEIHVEGEKALYNPYGVIAVNPIKGAFINAGLANDFIDWIISEPVQDRISRFGADKYPQVLFYPSSGPWKAAHPSQ